MSEKILAWHFVADNLRDGRPVPPDGVPLEHDGDLELCASGLHASRRIIDALAYAPGATVCRVECGGRIVEGADKLVCTVRTILWRVNATTTLRHFARQCALDVAHLWDMPAIVRRYLETGDETIRIAAWAAARDAWAAARDTARDARAAARAGWAGRAALAAASDAAWAAAWAAASDAARTAAWAAPSVKDAQNHKLERLVVAAHEEAINACD